MDLFAQLLTNGIIIGATYALIAIGLTLIFGMMRVVNFAHGEFYMLGAYVAVSAATEFNLGYFAALPIAVVLISIIGFCFRAGVPPSAAQCRYSEHCPGDHRPVDLLPEYCVGHLGA